MAITAAAIDRLKAQLLTSGLSQQNQALFQVINQLIGAVRQSLEGVEAITGSGGGGGGLASQSFFTENDDSASLPNSSQLLPGQAIEFQKSGSRMFIHSAVPFFPNDDQDDEEYGTVPLIADPSNIAYLNKGQEFIAQQIINANFAVTGALAIFSPGSTIIDNLTVNTSDVVNCLLDISNPAAGQIKFPATQNPSADANTFDDYVEKLPWTPTIVSSGGGAPTYTTNTGEITKEGNLVTGSFLIVLSGLGTLAAGTVTIAGLPYTASATNGIPFLMIFAGLGTNQIYLYAVVNPSTTSLIVRVQGAAAANNVTNLTVADLTAATVLAGGFAYFNNE